MTLGFKKGIFYRDAKLYCVNLLLTYQEGCRASCAFCGLSKTRLLDGNEREKTFIRVEWPIYELEKIIEALISDKCKHIERVCVSMVTNKRALRDILIVNEKISEKTDKSLSALISPTIISKDWLVELKNSGADKVGIAIDAATPELFDKLRGYGVKGPHKWDKYWSVVKESVKVFNHGNVGVHLIVGLGETEEQMAFIFQKVHNMRVNIHLFSFFPEPNSVLQDSNQPGIGQYRRIQLLRHLMALNKIHYENLVFNSKGQIIDFGKKNDLLDEFILEGKAFKTSGCSSKNLDVACNRPYANSTPFQAYMGECRNFPFDPTPEDIKLIKKQLMDYSNSFISTIENSKIFVKEDT